MTIVSDAPASMIAVNTRMTSTASLVALSKLTITSRIST